MRNPLIETARRWRDCGVTTIPLRPKSKLPVFRWRSWITNTPPEEYIDVWFKDVNRNIGVLCGNKFVVIDFDSKEEYSKFVERVPVAWKSIIDNTHRVETSRGVHVYVDPLQPTTTRHLHNFIDIRSTGSFVLAPPSTHPCGMKYLEDGKPILQVDSIEEVIPLETYELECFTKKDLGTWESVKTMDDGDMINAEHIKSALSIVEVVSWYTRVSRITKGSQWAIARCPHPSHEDRHPSFAMNLVNNRCNCLTPWCALHHQRWFDVFDLYCIMESVDFKTALSNLSKFI